MQAFIGKIGIFMICAQAILYFRPREAYGKYLRLLFSVMILIQILHPFLVLLWGESTVELEKEIIQFQNRMEQSMEQAAKVVEESEGYLEQKTVEEIQKMAEKESNAESLSRKIEIEEICIGVEEE